MPGNVRPNGEATKECCGVTSLDEERSGFGRSRPPRHKSERIGAAGQPIALPLSIPACLQDIARRWRMFYFHYYMAVALEGLFSWLVTELTDAGLVGRTLEELVKRLDHKTVRTEIGDLLGVKILGS